MKSKLDQKKSVTIMVLGIVAIVLAAINRFFLDNIAMSGIVVTLSIIFFVAVAWFYVNSKRAALKAQSKQTKQKSKN
jgi:Na+/melibiose symporter-like transporter